MAYIVVAYIVMAVFDGAHSRSAAVLPPCAVVAPRQQKKKGNGPALRRTFAPTYLPSRVPTAFPSAIPTPTPTDDRVRFRQHLADVLGPIFSNISELANNERRGRVPT